METDLKPLPPSAAASIVNLPVPPNAHNATYIQRGDNTRYRLDKVLDCQCPLSRFFYTLPAGVS